MKTIKEVELEEKLHRAWETQEQLEYENDKYKEVLDKIKKYIKEKDLTNNMNFMDDGIGDLFKDILELLEEIK